MVKQSKTVKILDFIASHPEGLRFTEIQRALWEMTHLRPFTRDERGWWCTNLCGGYYHAGILNFFATKGPDGLYRRNDIDHEGHPWRVMNAGK